MHDVAGLKLLILNEMHKPPYAGHPGYQKMVTIPRKQIFWPRLKVKLINYLSKWMGCQQVRIEHRYLVEILPERGIPTSWSTQEGEFLTRI